MAFYEETESYIGKIPANLSNKVEIKELDKPISIELNKLNAYIGKWIENYFIENADIDGVERWEKILDIYNPLSPDLQSRIDNIKSKLMTKPPINITTLKAIIEAYMGVEVDIEVKDYKATVWYRGTSKIADLRPLYNTIYNTIPAHIMCEILYRWLTWGELRQQQLTWGEIRAMNLTWGELARGEWIK